jgi:hypothetical protein
MTEVTIKLKNVSAQDLSVLVDWISDGLNNTFTDQSDTKLVLKLQRALDAAEAKKRTAEEKIEV